MFHNNNIMRKRMVIGKRKTTCSKCKNQVEESRKGQRYCKSCHAENMRKNRPTHSEMEPFTKKKHDCRAHTNVYLKRGNLIKEPCYNCGEKKVQAHHSDYDNPLKVHWLCRKCHLEMHSNPVMEERINAMEPTGVLRRNKTVNIILKAPLKLTTHAIQI